MKNENVNNSGGNGNNENRENPENKNGKKESFTDLEDSGKLVYYYSREHRLSRASRAVRELNSGGRRPGLLYAFTASRAHVILSASILIISAFIIIASIATRESNALTLGNNSVTVSAVRYEEGIFLALNKKSPRNGEAYSGVVDMAVSPVLEKSEKGTGGGEIPIFTYRIFFSLTEEEEYLIPLPFEGNGFFIIFQTSEERKSHRVSLSKKP
jgi:hypothetical protein